MYGYEYVKQAHSNKLNYWNINDIMIIIKILYTTCKKLYCEKKYV